MAARRLATQLEADVRAAEAERDSAVRAAAAGQNAADAAERLLENERRESSRLADRVVALERELEEARARAVPAKGAMPSNVSAIQGSGDDRVSIDDLLDADADDADERGQRAVVAQLEAQVARLESELRDARAAQQLQVPRTGVARTPVSPSNVAKARVRVCAHTCVCAPLTTS